MQLLLPQLTRSKMALDALLVVAAYSAQNAVVKTKDVANQIGVSLSYLEGTFSDLKRAGLISPIRGPGGGNILAIPPQSINVIDIVKAIDGANIGAIEKNAPSAKFATEFWTYVEDKLSKTSLADLLSAQSIPVTLPTKPLNDSLVAIRDQKKNKSKRQAKKLVAEEKRPIANSVFSLGACL